MADFRDKLENMKDKFVEEVSEAVEKITGDDAQELKDKIQSKISDLGNDIDEAKDNLVDKVNDLWEKKEEEK